MKKHIQKSILVLTLTMSVLVTQQANAMVILTLGKFSDTFVYKNTMGTIACIALLPLCLLEEDQTPAMVDAQDLKENGYGDEAIGRLMLGQERFNQALMEKRISISQDMAKDSARMADYLDRSNLGLPQEYTDFLRSNSF